MKQASITQAFWDYNFSENELTTKLKAGTNEQKVWIIGRIIENLPYETIWQYVTLPQLKTYFPYLSLRPQIKKIWTYTLDLWSKHEKRRFSH